VSKLALATLVLTLLARDACAYDTQDLAVKLGTVIGSEEACNLTYNQDAIQQWIARNVKPDDMDFPSYLQTFADGTKAEINSMSRSALTAHCAQIRRIAKQHGFIAQ
jgi:hypothetical protein